MSEVVSGVAVVAARQDLRSGKAPHPAQSVTLFPHLLENSLAPTPTPSDSQTKVYVIFA